jgi:hypothetical protein
MQRNIIILTSGLTGSSVLSGLISRAGYWTGDSTHKKSGTNKNERYNTYENNELIDLNLRLFREVGYTQNFSTDFSPEAIQRISGLAGKLAPRDFTAFLEKCNAHAPWIWKDPRLWMTIGFWKPLLDLDTCKFILLSRGLLQCWVSTTLRRQIRTYRNLKAYEGRVRHSILTFLEENGLSYLDLQYEHLIERPSETLNKINGYLDTALTVEDLRSIYHKPLGRAPRSSVADIAKAALIYMKNYPERVDVAIERK